MRIGYCVEGSTDRAMLVGPRDRWCPHAELVEGRVRGEFRRREIPKACLELLSKGVHIIILLRDANDEDWRDVAKADKQVCAPNCVDLAVVGIRDRNVECWLVADKEYAAKRTGKPADEFRVVDPKGPFDRALTISAIDRKVDDIIQWVVDAPLRRWLDNRSFERFYEDLRQQSKRLGCELENLRQG